MTAENLLPESHGDEQVPEAPKKRRPGAPLGNTNALKHGYYSRRFNQVELSGVEDINYSDLEDEIALLRVSMRRVIEWSHDIKSLSEAVSYLRVLALASASLSRIIRTHHVMGLRQPNPLVEALAELDAELEASQATEPDSGTSS